MAYLKEKLEYYLHFFGYAKDERPEFALETTHTENGNKF